MSELILNGRNINDYTDGGALLPTDWILIYRDSMNASYKVRQIGEAPVLLCGTTLTVGQVVYLGADGMVYPALAGDGHPLLGICAKDATIGQVFVYAPVYCNYYSDLSVGSVYYLSDVVPGEITSGVTSVPIGLAVTTEILKSNI